MENFPVQQLEKGTAKNVRTRTSYRKVVRILKRAGIAMAEEGIHREPPSFFVECLAYNCPDNLLLAASWTQRVRGVLVHIWQSLQADEEPSEF